VTLLQIALWFGLLSMMAFGGMPSVMPEMQRMVVEVNGWATADEFIQLFAIGQAAPGPNVLIVSLIGWKVAGLAGALVALFAVCGPSAVLAWWVSGLWERFKDSPWRKAIAQAIAPLVVGLILSAGYVLATPGGTPDWRLWLVAGAACAGNLLTRLNPLWLIAAGGVAGPFLAG
jgi:chromate transporter